MPKYKLTITHDIPSESIFYIDIPCEAALAQVTRDLHAYLDINNPPERVLKPIRTMYNSRVTSEILDPESDIDAIVCDVKPQEFFVFGKLYNSHEHILFQNISYRYHSWESIASGLKILDPLEVELYIENLKSNDIKDKAIEMIQSYPEIVQLSPIETRGSHSYSHWDSIKQKYIKDTMGNCIYMKANILLTLGETPKDLSTKSEFYNNLTGPISRENIWREYLTGLKDELLNISTKMFKMHFVTAPIYHRRGIHICSFKLENHKDKIKNALI